MMEKLYSIGITTVEVVLLLCKVIYSIAECIYRIIVPPEEKSVAGEVVLVTGAGHGIGRELAIQYAELGATVICVDVNEKGNEETAQIIKEKGLSKAFAYKCDVRKREEVLAVVSQATKDTRKNVTVLVNNAGIMPAHTLLDHEPAEIENIFQVNVLAHFWFLEAVLPDMVKKNHGHIVALSSMAGIVGLQNLVPYCSSKFAVRGLMEGLVEELREKNYAPNVRCTCIFPYMVNTGLCKNPIIKFEGLLKLVPPNEAAAAIIRAMRRNELMCTIPSFLLVLNNTIRCFPVRAGQYVKDFFGGGVDPCDKRFT